MLAVRIRYADAALDDIASVLCASHARAAQYLAQIPALVLAVPQKFGSHVTYGELDAFAETVGKEPRLKTLFEVYGLPKQARNLCHTALRFSDRAILAALYTLNPSTLAQVIPAASGQRSWLAGCSAWLRLDAERRLPLDWLARRMAEDQSRTETVDQLLDWINRAGGRVNGSWSWANAMAAVEAWHVSLRSEREIRLMLANKAMAERYDKVICQAPIPDKCEAEGYTFIALRTPRSLRDEGATIRHCVGTYDSLVEAGRSAIVSIRKDGVNVATAEYNFDGILVQIKAHHNAAPSQAVKSAAELFGLMNWRKQEAA